MAFGDVVQTNTGTSTSATTSPTLGSAVTAGNIVVLTFAADDYNGSVNSGWTQSSEMEQQTFHGGYLWWFKSASGGDTIPSYTIGSAVRSNWHLVEYAGPFDASPYDVSEGQLQATSTTSYTTPSMTPTAGDRLMVVGMQFQNDNNDMGTPGTWLNSFSQATSTVYNSANPRLAIGQARLVVTANGSTAYSSGATIASGIAISKTGLIIAFKAGAGGATEHEADAQLAGSAAVVATGQRKANVDAQLAGSAAVTATGLRKANVDSQLAGSAAVAATTVRVANVDAQLSASAALSGDAKVVHNVDAQLSGSATLSGDAEIDGAALEGDAQLSGSATLSGDAKVVRNVDAQLSASATVVATATRQANVTAQLSGSAALVATAEGGAEVPPPVVARRLTLTDLTENRTITDVVAVYIVDDDGAILVDADGDLVLYQDTTSVRTLTDLTEDRTMTEVFA